MGLNDWNSNNILKFTIDNSSVSEDLVNFPVLLNLSTSSGKNTFNCSNVFTELFTENAVNYSEYVCFYLNFENNFVDETGKHTLTTTATPSSSIKKFGSKSAYVYYTVIDISLGNDLVIGTNDFSFHGWFYFTTVNEAITIFELGTYLTGIVLSINSGSLFWGIAGTWEADAGWAVTANVWTHIALTRSQGVARSFINGVKLGERYNYTSNITTPARCRLGIDAGFVNGTFRGYMDEVVFVNSIAIWTDNFTVATSPIIIGHSLPKKIAVVYPSVQEHLMQEYDDYTKIFIASNNSADGSNTIIDSSNFKNTLSVTNAKHSTVRAIYGTSSLYFNGSSYLTLAAGSLWDFGLLDFTIECWIYITSYSANGARIFQTADGDVVVGIYFLVTSVGLVNASLSINGSSFLFSVSVGNVLALNTFYHVAYVRYGTEFSVYINGSKYVVYTGSAYIYYNATATPIIGGQATGLNRGLNGYIDKFKISKGIARYTTSFANTIEIPTISYFPSNITNDIYWDNNILAMPMEGANNSTIFIDLKGKAVTAGGNAKISTTQYKFGNSSAFFDGNGDYIAIPTSSDLAFGTGDFTVECWVYPAMPAGGGNNNDRCMYGYTNSSNSMLFFLTNDYNTPALWDQYSQSTSSISCASNTWSHVAYSRYSGTLRIFVNGVNSFTGTVTTNFTPTSNFCVGGTSNGYFRFYSGYIDNVLITKGVAKYTSNFTTPTTGINVMAIPEDPYYSQVVLALPMVGAILDLKGTPLTVYGNTSLSNTVSKFGTSSCYFDGTGDYIALGYSTDLDLLGSTFTIELWMYSTAVGASKRIISSGGGAIAWNTTTGIHWLLQYETSGGGLSFQYFIGGTSVASLSIASLAPQGQWNFIAISMSNNVVYVVVNNTIQSFNITGLTAVRPFTNPLLFIGSINGENGASNAYVGYIKDIRITKGVTRYTTSNFTIHESAYEKTSLVRTYTYNANQQLYCEIERWDNINKSAQLWVNVPRVLSNQPTDIFLYFDRTQADNINYIGYTGESVAQKVWDSNYAAVYHLSQDPSIGGACIKDSTYNMRHATPYGSMTSASVVSGVVSSKATLFNGTSQYLECGTFDPRPLNNEVTLEVTYALMSISTTAYIFIKGNDNLQQSYGIGLPSPNNMLALAYNNSYPPAWPSTPSRDVSQNFTYAAEVISGSTVTGYDYDTSTAATAIPGTYATTTAPFRIAATNRGAPYTYYTNAKVREARISQVARSTSWLKTTNRSTMDNLCTITSGTVYKFSGYITEKNVPVERPVYLYDRASGELMDKCMSSPSGYYSLNTTISGVHNIVCLDDSIGISYEDLIMSKVLPTGVL